MTGKFIHIPLATLTTMLADWQACLTAIATAHQQYSIAGRTFTRANLIEVSEMVGEISYAKALAEGSITRTTYSDFST